MYLWARYSVLIGTFMKIGGAQSGPEPNEMFFRKLTRSIVVGAAAIAVAGGSYGSSALPPGSSPAATSAARTGKAGFNARYGPAAGGASGTVSSVSTSSFTLSTSAGQKVTVDEAFSTAYQKGTNSTSASAVTTALAAYPGGIVDRGEAEQRRVQRPLHRRQLAAPHIRQRGLRGRRGRVVRQHVSLV